VGFAFETDFGTGDGTADERQEVGSCFPRALVACIRGSGSACVLDVAENGIVGSEEGVRMDSAPGGSDVCGASLGGRRNPCGIALDTEGGARPDERASQADYSGRWQWYLID
jgi:hypothetical protein